MDSAEIWAPINGYDGMYEVSNLGRVRSLVRVVDGRYGPRTMKGRVLRQNPDCCGFRMVRLSRTGVARTRQVHRLVAQHFLTPPPDKY